MSCGSGNCDCGGQGGKQEPTETTPITNGIKATAKSASPGPLSKAAGWIGHIVFADMRITRIRVIAQAFFFRLFSMSFF